MVYGPTVFHLVCNVCICMHVILVREHWKQIQKNQMKPFPFIAFTILLHVVSYQFHQFHQKCSTLFTVFIFLFSIFFKSLHHTLIILSCFCKCSAIVLLNKILFSYSMYTRIFNLCFFVVVVFFYVNLCNKETIIYYVPKNAQRNEVGFVLLSIQY